MAKTSRACIHCDATLVWNGEWCFWRCPNGHDDADPEAVFCPHGIHFLSPCGQCAEDKHGENRLMQASPSGGPHPLAPDHDEDSMGHVCAVAGCVPITACVGDGEQPCLRRSPDGSLCTVVRGHSGPHAAWSDPDGLPRAMWR